MNLKRTSLRFAVGTAVVCIATGCESPGAASGLAVGHPPSGSTADRKAPAMPPVTTEPNPKPGLTPPPAYQPAPCVPPATPYAQAIINAGQGTPLGSASNFTAGSSWAGATGRGGPYLEVWAGYAPTPVSGGGSGPPAVVVFREQAVPTGCGYEPVMVGVFREPAADGPFIIDSVANDRLTLSTPSRRVWTFSLMTDQFAE